MRSGRPVTVLTVTMVVVVVWKLQSPAQSTNNLGGTFKVLAH